MDAVIGLDVGATRIKAGIVAEGRLLGTEVVHVTVQDATAEGTITRMDQISRDLASRHGIPWERVAGVGIGAPGVIRHDTGVIVQSPNFPEWKNFPLGELLAARIGRPVRLDNDVNAITLGEARFGAGRGRGDFVCVALGSGVGGGLFLGGDVFRGADGMAGEIGHMVVDPEGPPCNCGGRGCLEQYASRVGLRRCVIRDQLFGALTEAAADDPHLPERLFEAASMGDSRCIGYFEEIGYRLAIALGGVLNLLNVHTVVLGGGIARALPAFEPALLRELPGRAFPPVVAACRIVSCELWEDGGVLGAAALMDNRVARM